MKHKKIIKGLYIWKWGLNFNEGSKLSLWIPFTMAINLLNLRFYFSYYIPWVYYGVDICRLDTTKKWRFCWKHLFQVVIYK